jgi:hypothetical protein
MDSFTLCLSVGNARVTDRLLSSDDYKAEAETGRDR